MDQYSSAWDGVPAWGIPAGLNGAPADQVHAAVRKAGKFILNVLVVEQSPPRALGNRDQVVDMPGVRGIGGRGPEQSQLGNPLSLAKCG
jgi:hypothetical protein